MTTYKLVYFNARGGAEVIRLIFAQAGVTYEDKRVDRDEWAKLKPSTPTGQLPILEVNGKAMHGSRPIARLVAERYGLAGSTDMENAELGGIIDFLFDFIKNLIPWFYEQDEEKKAELAKNIAKDHIPKFWSIFEKWIQENKSEDGWIYGNKPTYADFSIYCILDTMPLLDPDFFTTYPGVAKLKAAVEALPNIAKWLQERPKTER